MIKKKNVIFLKLAEMGCWAYLLLSVLPNGVLWNVLLQANRLGLDQAWGFGMLTFIFAVFLTKFPITTTILNKFEIYGRNKKRSDD